MPNFSIPLSGLTAESTALSAIANNLANQNTAGFLGFDPLVRLSHRAEDVLNTLRRGETRLTQRMMDALLSARDQLGRMLSDIRQGGLKEYRIDSLLAELESVQTPLEAPLRVGEILVAQGKIDPGVLEAALQEHAASPGAPKLGEFLVQKGLASAAEVGNALVSQKQAADATANAGAQTMRVDVRKLDELIDLIGELVLERNRLVQLGRDLSTDRLHFEALNSALGQSTARLSFITEELQAAGLKTRMVPIDTVFRKFPRLVRDCARSLEKEVELVLSGEATELDKTMVELIGDPLVHLVRNSLDHGLEKPEARIAAGKPRIGRIRLDARQEGDQILVGVADDGVGIDPDRIAQKALEKRLVTPERLRSLSRREILDFVFLPGFSTAAALNDLSGRGVGMDVVRTNVKRLNGTIELDSRPGAGTTVWLRLPLTLAILPVLMVQVSAEMYALPLRSVLETARLTKQEVHMVEGNEVLLRRGETLPLLRLGELFGASRGDESKDDQKVVILAVSERRVALLVDRLVGQESTVIKPLSSYLHHGCSLAGATISGDGRVCLILDPSGLLTLVKTRLPQEVA
jgi:two-component system chemotaxis sensor kinase CheA